MIVTKKPPILWDNIAVGGILLAGGVFVAIVSTLVIYFRRILGFSDYPGALLLTLIYTGLGIGGLGILVCWVILPLANLIRRKINHGK
jgi:hypothetical protein